MKKYLYMFVAVALIVTGCATKVEKEWSVVGGSKSDATVRLAFEHSDLEIPVIDDSRGQKLATKRCQAWGYKDAVPFDKSMSNCLQVAGLGQCAYFRVTTEYQCINQ